MDTRDPILHPIRFCHEGRSRFHAELQLRVDEYFRREHCTRYATAWMRAKIAIYFLLWLSTYAVLLLAHLGAAAALGLAVLFGVLSVLLVFNVGHDATHGALSAWRWLNRTLAILSVSGAGANAYLYALIHNTPHPFPNVTGVDVTLDQVDSVLRLSPNAPRRRYHRWQHLYAPAVYALYSLFLVFVKDFRIFRRQRVGNHRVAGHPLRERVLLILFKGVYVGYALVVPLYVLPFPWYGILAGFLATHLVMGLLLAAVLQPVHLAFELSFAEPDENGRINEDWATYQLRATKDFAPQSLLANCLLGGLNTHVIHHLFPAVCHVHYRALTRILAQTCAEFGVPYTSQTFARALRSHFDFLKMMGELPARALTPGLPMRLPPGAGAAPWRTSTI